MNLFLFFSNENFGSRKLAKNSLEVYICYLLFAIEVKTNSNFFTKNTYENRTLNVHVKNDIGMTESCSVIQVCEQWRLSVGEAHSLEWEKYVHFHSLLEIGRRRKEWIHWPKIFNSLKTSKQPRLWVPFWSFLFTLILFFEERVF